MQARFRRILVFVLVGAMLVLAVPSSAFAGESTYRVIWGPNVVPGPSGGGGGHPIDGGSGSGGGAGTTFDGDASGTLYGVMVYAPNKYAAAMLVCGVAWNDSRMDHDKRMALSNEASGGAFYTFAQRFSTISDGSGSFSVPDFYGNSYKNENMLWGVCSTYSKMYGPVNIYEAIYTSTQSSQALSALRAILDGEGSGGESGGGTGDVGSGPVYELSLSDEISSDITIRDVRDVSISHEITLGDNVMSWIRAQSRNYYAIATSGYDSGRCYIFLFDNEDDINANVGVNTGYINFGNVSNSTITYDRVYGTLDATGKLESIRLSGVNKSLNAGDNTSQSDCVYYWPIGDTGGGTGGGDGPVGDWPDDDGGNTESPTPPELPTPRDPTIPVEPTDPIVTDTPAPSLPDPTDPTIPVIGEPTDDDNFTVDLQGILDALNEHCIHLQQRMTIVGEYVASSFQASINDMISANNTALQTYAGNIVTNLHTEMFATRSVIGSKIGWLIDDINECFGVLMEYLEDLWGFLDERLDFSFSSYNDDSLMGWLEKIYMKLGSGIDTTPVDPVSDPDGSGDWLSQFLASFFGALLGSLASVLGEATSAMATLATKFPFSIPWDIMAILGLLVAQPVCPDVVIPCYSLTANGLSQVGSYEIDLQDIEFAVEGIRWMLRIGFILLLLSRTKDFIQLIEGVIG